MDIRFFTLAGQAGIYQETSSYLPGVVLGAALDGMGAIGRPSETEAVRTGLRVEKDAENWQVWLASFEYWNAESDVWYLSEVLRQQGTLTYGDAVSVTAVPVADMLQEMIDLIDYDAAYPIVVEDASLLLTRGHHGKTIVCQQACSLSLDLSYALRSFQCDLVQGGTGQIVLAASPYANFNGAGTGVAHALPNVRYSRARLMKLSWNGFMVTNG